MRRTLLRSPAFGRDIRSWLKRHPDAAASIETTLEQLSADAAHPSLRVHKLRGSLAGCWACSAGYDLRIVFECTQHEGQEAILLLALGTQSLLMPARGALATALVVRGPQAQGAVHYSSLPALA